MTDIYRHTARTAFGTFEVDHPCNFLFCVVSVGHRDDPEGTERALLAAEGTCFGWAGDLFAAEVMSQVARERGRLNVFVSAVHHRRRLAGSPVKESVGIRYRNRS